MADGTARPKGSHMRAFLLAQLNRPIVRLLLFCSELAANITQFLIDGACRPAVIGPTLAFLVRLGTSTLLPVIVVVLLVIALWDNSIAPSALGELGLVVAGVLLGALQVYLQYGGLTCFVGRYFLVFSWLLAVVAVIKMVRWTWGTGSDLGCDFSCLADSRPWYGSRSPFRRRCLRSSTFSLRSGPPNEPASGR